jgi:hypothetical protein
MKTTQVAKTGPPASASKQGNVADEMRHATCSDRSASAKLASSDGF